MKTIFMGAVLGYLLGELRLRWRRSSWPRTYFGCAYFDEPRTGGSSGYLITPLFAVAYQNMGLYVPNLTYRTALQLSVWPCPSPFSGMGLYMFRWRWLRVFDEVQTEQFGREQCSAVHPDYGVRCTSSDGHEVGHRHNKAGSDIIVEWQR